MKYFVPLVTLNGYLTLFLTYCLLLGLPLANRLCTWGDGKEIGLKHLKLFFAISVGLCAVVLVLFALGMAGLFRPSVILLSFSILLAALLASLFISGGTRTTNEFVQEAFSLGSGDDRRLLSVDILVLCLLLLIISAQAVAVPGRWDDTLYHLPMARSYIDNGAIVTNAFLRYPLFPQNMELLFALGLMIQGDIMAQGMATVPLFICSIGLIGAAEKFTESKIPGYLSIVALLYTPFITSTLGYAYIDNGLALFCWGSTLALAIWENLGRRYSGWLVLAGVLAGGAAGTKLFGGIQAAILGLFILVRCRSWKEPVYYAISVLAVGVWWYFRSTVISGDPIHPVGGNIFGYYLWDAGDLFFQKQEQATHGTKRQITYVFHTLVTARVQLWLLAFLFILYIRRTALGVSVLYYTFVVYFFFWFYVTQVNRYLSPICVVATFLSIAFLYYLTRSCVSWIWSAGSSALGRSAYPGVLFLLALAPTTVHAYSRAVSKLEKWERSLLERPGYEMFQQANKVEKSYGNRILQIGFERGIYFYQGVVIGDHFGPGRYRDMKTCSPQGGCQIDEPERIIDRMRSFNCRLLAVDGLKVRIDIEKFTPYFNVLWSKNNGYLLSLK